jgi:thiosulfate/3-mercaptopyruvate sulfurtransferase
MEVELEEVARRLGEDGFVVLDVRSEEEYTGRSVASCDPRAGRIPGARHLDVYELLELQPEEVRERLGDPVRNEFVTYCHSGSRSALAAEILRGHGYHAANYRGSWHEWSREESLPAEKG